MKTTWWKWKNRDTWHGQECSHGDISVPSRRGSYSLNTLIRMLEHGTLVLSMTRPKSGELCNEARAKERRLRKTRPTP